MGRFARAYLFACFLFTGAFGLIYEVVWSRYLALMIGNTAHAYVAVLAAFMGGLAIGAVAFGRAADRLTNAAKAYGWLETAVGAYALCFPAIYGALERAMLPLGRAMGIGTFSMAAFKFLFAMACLLPPTILMGGTLPILTRGLTASTAGLRRSIGALYGLNSAGAVGGCLVAGFYLVERWGLPGCMTIVGSMNAVLGLLAVLFSGWLSPAPTPLAPAASPPTDAPPVAADEIIHAPAVRAAALALAGFSGFAGLALETAWIRYFALALGSSATAFSLMLAAFITGISLGALWLSSRRAGRFSLMRVLLAALLASALFLAASLELYERLPHFLWALRTLFRPSPASYVVHQVVAYGVCFLMMAVPTIAAGLVFPAAVRLASQATALGRGVGRIYAVNTIGAVLGAMLTGLALFSWIGLENIFRLLIVAYAAAGGALAFRFLGGGKWKWAGAAALILAAHLIGYRPLNPLAINLGFYMRNDIPPAFAETRRLADQYAPLFVGEGPHAMVTVREKGPSNLLPGQPHRSLAINGKVDASTNIDMLTQVLLGHLPMLLHPDPRDVFVVGLGSGVTAGAALTYGAQVDVAEISREVVAAERFFEEVNLQPLRNPRCRLIIEDAKTALRYEPKQYDVIISEPTNPWIAGVAGLFSVEFYRSVRARLRPGGVFAQWMPCYKTSDRTMAVTVATLLRSFPYVDVFQTMPSDFLFIAGDRPLGVDPDRLAARLARPETAADLARIHAVNPVSLLSTQLKGARRLRADFTGAEVNSDFRPLIEYRAPAALFFDDYSALLGGMDDRPFGDPELLLSKYLAQRPLTAADVRALIAFYPLPIYGGSAPVANGLLRLSRRFLGEDAPETQTIYAAVASASTRDAAAQAAMFALPASPTPLSVARRLELALQSYDATWQLWAPPPAEELTELADWLDRHGGNSTEARLQMARVFCSRGLKRACDEQTGKIEGALANDPAGAPALVAIAAARFECAERHWDFAAAEAQLEKLGQLGPQGLARRAELFVRFDRDRRAAAAEDRI